VVVMRLLGIIGALVGGFLFSLFGASGVTGLNIYSMIVATVGGTSPGVRKVPILLQKGC
jgi:uncharacterized membrane protein YeaQ/YmgE (transglycosylase-associated protein family)